MSAVFFVTSSGNLINADNVREINTKERFATLRNGDEINLRFMPGANTPNVIAFGALGVDEGAIVSGIAESLHLVRKAIEQLGGAQ